MSYKRLTVKGFDGFVVRRTVNNKPFKLYFSIKKHGLVEAEHLARSTDFNLKRDQLDAKVERSARIESPHNERSHTGVRHLQANRTAKGRLVFVVAIPDTPRRSFSAATLEGQRLAWSKALTYYVEVHPSMTEAEVSHVLSLGFPFEDGALSIS